MNNELGDLRVSVLDKQAFGALEHFKQIGVAYLKYVSTSNLKNIVSPSQHHYFFYQYDADNQHKITRPLNANLFITNEQEFKIAFERFVTFLGDVKQHQETIVDAPGVAAYLETNEINRVVYTVQQSIGCIADSFQDANQARKRVGLLFESLVKLIIREVGLICEPRLVKIPIPDQAGYEMRYELDVVFSRNKAVIAAETNLLAPVDLPTTEGKRLSHIEYIAAHEIVGSVKTTSKDRIDKIFLDKYLLTKLLGRDIPVVAVFLHDVQRATGSDKNKGQSIFNVASTFKTGHFLGYSVALNKLDGVYYVDPRPEMKSNPKLAEQIKDFGYFLTHDLWVLSK